MTARRFPFFAVMLLLQANLAWADAPTASYIFPAGGQRGTHVAFKVGGANLFQSCGFEMLGAGIQAPKTLQRTSTLWLEGPVLPLPDSQQAEDYPKDMAGKLSIATDADLGLRSWRVWTSQGATPALRFLVGELPETIEEEVAGDPVPVPVKLPITVNGRIFPREDVDVWAFPATKGQTIAAEVHAARLGSPLDARLEVLDPHGRPLAENDDAAGADSFVCFTAPEDGTYSLRIHDIQFKGGPAYVYRLTVQARPHVAHWFPLGGRRGSKLALDLGGQGLTEPRAEVTLPADDRREFHHRVTVGGQASNPLMLEIDDLPEHLQTPAAEQPLAVPAILNGRIAKAGQVDAWAIAARKGEVLDLDLRAARLGSPLCAVLTVFDSTGKELARAENVGGPADPQLRFTPPADGTYTLKVEERFRGRGSPAHAYRLRVAPPSAPDFRLTLASDAVTLPRGGTVKLKVNAERLGGFAEAIALEIDGLPTGVTATGTTIAAKQATVDVTLKAEAPAVIAASRVTIRGSARIGEATLTRTATLPPVRGLPDIDSVLLGVALPTPFKIVGDYDMRWASRGTTHERKYRIERTGYDGAIEVGLADRQARHLQGVTGPNITVPAGATEFSYRVYLPPWMETGRTCRVCVAGVAVVKDADGTEHTVSFSSTNQNEQIVAVVEPGRLGIEAAPGSLAVEPGQSGELTVQIARGKGLQGTVKLELVLPAHWRGISAEPVTIAADQTSARFTVRFAADARGPFNMPATVRATLTEKGLPIVAETQLTLQGQR
ncbi:MAG: PPC domain-containing protein [Planctomycetia bacterium]|nr:PPC domain-containing protein [Planctomycetia bacterium]